jgi:hypothetical protein
MDACTTTRLHIQNMQTPTKKTHLRNLQREILHALYSHPFYMSRSHMPLHLLTLMISTRQRVETFALPSVLICNMSKTGKSGIATVRAVKKYKKEWMCSAECSASRSGRFNRTKPKCPTFCENLFLIYSLWFTKYDTTRGKLEEIPVQAWTGPDCSGTLRLPDFKRVINLMEAIPLCDSIEVHTYLHIDTTKISIVSNYI